jgi:hypothetical protein
VRNTIDNTAATIGVALGARIKVTRIDTKNNNIPGIKNSIYSILFFDFTYFFYYFMLFYYSVIFILYLNFVNQIYMGQHMFAATIPIQT